MALWDHLKAHRDFLKRTGSLAEKRTRQAREEATALAMAQIARAVQGALDTPMLADAINAVQERREPPSFAARRLLEALKGALP
ncbi:hypothetical protein D3C86_1599220 [compost metagenome]